METIIMRQPNKNERGQALILIVFAIVGLIGMTALTVDGGNAYSDRRHAQNAADTAVLAGARAIIRGEAWKPAALSIASENGYSDTDDTITSSLTRSNVEVYRCDEADAAVDCGVYDGDAEYIQVKITSIVSTFFGRVVGIQQLTNKVQAIAKVIPGSFDEMFDGNAMVGLSPAGCAAVTIQGNVNATVTGGGIFVNSSCTPNAFDNDSGSAQLSAPSLCAVGGIDETGINVPQQSEGCDDVGFPPENMVMPNITCGSTTSTQTGGNMSPGNYTSGDFPPAGVIYLESGVYCISGANNDFKLNAGDVLTGNNVVIYVIDGDVDINGGAEMNLDAPDSGPYAGLLFYLPLGTPIDHTVSINGNSGSTLTGTILAPTSHCKINGDGGIDEVNGQVICYTVAMEGNSPIEIHYNDNQNWNAQELPQLELTR
jgi:hypothetical protein